MFSLGLAALVLRVTLVAAATNRWQHGWDKAGDMTFSDFTAQQLFTNAQIKFAAAKYRVLSLEKCTGRINTTTEEAIYTTARAIKQTDPTVKIIFYWATDQQGISCYEAGKEWLAHPEWYLRDDNVRTRDACRGLLGVPSDLSLSPSPFSPRRVGVGRCRLMMACVGLCRGIWSARAPSWIHPMQPLQRGGSACPCAEMAMARGRDNRRTS